MARYRVTCTTKHDKYERILALGCYTPTNVFLTFTEAQVIDRIENHGDTFMSSGLLVTSSTLKSSRSMTVRST